MINETLFPLCSDTYLIGLQHYFQLENKVVSLLQPEWAQDVQIFFFN